MADLASLYCRSRAAMPLAVLLLFLNTARSLPGGLDGSTLLCGFAFWWLVQLSYIYDSLFRTREDAVNLPGAAEGSGRTWPVFAAAAGPAAYIAWLGFWPMIAVALTIIPLYSDPSLGWRRLKTVPVVKSLVSVLNFWLVGVLVPVLLKNDFSAQLLFSVLQSSAPLLVFLFLLTVLLDVRDVEGDREGGVMTLPVLFGARAAAAATGIVFAAGAWALLRSERASDGLLPAFLALFAFAAAKPRGRSFYEWMLAAVNFYLAARLLTPP